MHGKEEADKAQATARALFSGNVDDADMPTTVLEESSLTDGAINIMDLLVAGGLAKSKSEARRLVEQGGISVDGAKVEGIDANVTKEQIAAGAVVKKGKKVYHKYTF